MATIHVSSPKRGREALSGWEGFFPYYAGYPARFAVEVIRSANLAPLSSVLDPWNGSGTTTYAAAQLGHTAIGFDVNPVMTVIARARMLSPSEADSLGPLCKEILRGARAHSIGKDEPLLTWFDARTAAYLRSIERSIRRCLVGTRTQSNLAHLSCMAATFYSALFSVGRDMTSSFRSSNPTWMRLPKESDQRISEEPGVIASKFIKKIESMSAALSAEGRNGVRELTLAACCVGDSTELPIQDSSIDLVLGSPPYCTRIDYAAATRVELSLIAGLAPVDFQSLGQRMIGSTRVPLTKPKLNEEWGRTCLTFLEQVETHPSKASAGYYYKTHLAYFDKMFKSMRVIASALRPSAKAVLVVQDSYYKDVHNPLPQIFTEMARSNRLAIIQRQDFSSGRSMGNVNRASRRYRENDSPIESVLCFEKLS